MYFNYESPTILGQLGLKQKLLEFKDLILH